MKLIVLFLFLSSTTALAASFETLKKEAEEKFIGHYDVTHVVKLKPKEKTETLIFSNPITKVEVNRVDNLIMKAKYSLEALGMSLMGEDADAVEIFIYSGEERTNCYAFFSNGEFGSLYRCTKIYKPLFGD